MTLFLTPLSRTLKPAGQAVLVWDGAGFHRAHDVIGAPNITLVTLPPYSPELNPVENLWHDLRSHPWSNRKHHGVDAHFDAAETAWLATGLNPEIIRTGCHAPDAQTRGQFSGMVSARPLRSQFADAFSESCAPLRHL